MRVGVEHVDVPIGSLAAVHASNAPASGSVHSTAAEGVISSSSWVRTRALDGVLRALGEDHAAGSHACLVGAAGSGKSALVEQFASRFGYSMQLVPLYRDMTSHDLLQRRQLDAKGNTSWQMSPVVEAALSGGLCVLDGLHRLRPDGLVALQRLLTDGETVLFDGTRLLSHSAYDTLKAQIGADADRMVELSLLRVHPSFRVVALAEPPTLANRWLSSEIMTLFSWHELPSIASSDARDRARWLTLACPRLEPEARDALMRVAKALEAMGGTADGEGSQPREASHGADERSGPGAGTHDASVGVEAAAHSGGLSLSARQMLRVARRAEASTPSESSMKLDASVQSAQLVAVLDGVRRSVVAELMSPALSDDLEQRIGEVLPKGIRPPHTPAGGTSASGGSKRDVCIRADHGVLTIGDASLQLGQPTRPELVPQIAFTDNVAHLHKLESMALDLMSGERALLLIGSQGTGKNKLADRLLQLMRRERDYMQLHRDTTVQSLTVEPTLVDGSIEWRDSPLVHAVTHGHVRIIPNPPRAHHTATFADC